MDKPRGKDTNPRGKTILGLENQEHREEVRGSHGLRPNFGAQNVFKKCLKRLKTLSPLKVVPLINSPDKRQKKKNQEMRNKGRN